jgi:hypothetical protein
VDPPATRSPKWAPGASPVLALHSCRS